MYFCVEFYLIEIIVAFYMGPEESRWGIQINILYFISILKWVYLNRNEILIIKYRGQVVILKNNKYR